MKSNDFSLPSKFLKLNILGNVYELTFPKVGQFIDIENRKILYSNKQYANLTKQGFITSNLAAEMIEASAYFTTLIPDLEKNLKVNNLFELEVENMVSLLKIYRKSFLPWLNEWLKAINEFNKEELEEDPLKESSSTDNR